MKIYSKSPVAIKGFKWDGNLNTIYKNIPKSDRHCFRLINNHVIYVRTFDNGWVIPQVNQSMIIKSKFGYNICSLSWFQNK